MPPLARLVRAWRRLRPLVGDVRWRVAALAVGSVLSGLSEAAVLALVAQIATVMVSGSGLVQADLGPLSLDAPVATLLLVTIGLGVARLVLQVGVAYLPARISADVQARLRKDLFAAFVDASWAVQAQERDGHLQELMTSQILRATEVVEYVASLLAAALMFATLVASALILSVPAALLVMLVSGVLFLVMRPLSRWGQTFGSEHSEAHVGYAGSIGEAVRMTQEMQVFGTGDAHRRRVDARTDAAREPFFRTQFLRKLVPVVYQSLVILLIVGGLAGLYASGGDRLASLGAVVLILVRAAAYGQQMQGGYHALNELLPYVDRLREAADRYRASSPRDGDRPVPEIVSLSFRDVAFGYTADTPVLRGVSFVVEQGEAIGIVGPSGVGKSTLVQLLLRLRCPDEGDYFVNGIPADALDRADWQTRTAFVPQEPRLLHATVSDNIRYLRDLDARTVQRAARLAHIHDEVVSWPEGYDTIVGQRADAVSGGQRQRLCLARALAGDPEILVLDEPTSSLDLPSEALIQQALSRLRGRLTLFVVAHRLSTLEVCDRVMVLRDGRVEDFAPASELARRNRFYREAVSLSGSSTRRPA